MTKPEDVIVDFLEQHILEGDDHRRVMQTLDEEGQEIVWSGIELVLQTLLDAPPYVIEALEKWSQE